MAHRCRWLPNEMFSVNSQNPIWLNWKSFICMCNYVKVLTGNEVKLEMVLLCNGVLSSLFAWFNVVLLIRLSNWIIFFEMSVLNNQTGFLCPLVCKSSWDIQQISTFSENISIPFVISWCIASGNVMSHNMTSVVGNQSTRFITSRNNKGLSIILLDLQKLNKRTFNHEKSTFSDVDGSLVP